ncbi:MAG: LemA family protein [Bacilli bacterium]|nr:LemA family protein [Bacilli bacterium]
MDLIKLLLIILILSVILIFAFCFIYNKIKVQILKINTAESEIDESLRIKYDLITKIIAEIKKIDKDNKSFKDLDKLKDEELSSFEFERKLVDIEKEIYTIKNENNQIQKNTAINDLWYEITSTNTKIKAGEKYYNESTTLYNKLVTTYPSKLVALIMKLEEKKYFDGKDMYDKNIKDFKI